MTGKKANRGYVIGNSAIAAEAGVNCLFTNVRFNPPYFEYGKNSIVPVGDVFLKVYSKDTELPLSDIEITENTYPRYSARYSFGGTELSVVAFAPISVNDVYDMFLPAVILEITVLKRSGSLALSLSFEGDGEYVRFAAIGDSYGESAAKYTVGDTEDTVFAVFGVFDGMFPSSEKYKSAKETALSVLSQREKLKAGYLGFAESIPAMEGEKATEYFRWYTQAAVMLTKADNSGKVITMGYTELNQRDSFWTTFMHLMLFPELERRMISLSCENQREDGKIPTTLFPEIEREFDIDINEYFCLRIARYYRYHKDKEFLTKCFPYYKRSVDFLLTRDRDGDCVPEQEPPENPECFWGDWKDVSYIIGRKLSPHFALLWLAVLKEGVYLAKELSCTEVAEKYRKIYAAAFEKINSEWTGRADGGLWNKNRYTEVWYDGEKRDFILEDQTVGIFFDVVPKEKIPLIYSALTENECEYGIKETFPYRTGDEVWNRGGTYHNGGIWPWLMFCDIAGRYKNGREKEALSLIEKLGYYDLEVPGDYRPNEYLDAENGANCGFEVQGWSSAVWALEYVKRMSPAS